MEARQLDDCMALLGWTDAGLAAQLGCATATVTRWRQGTSRFGMPPAVAEWITRRADAALILPVPVGWRTRIAGQAYNGIRTNPG